MESSTKSSSHIKTAAIVFLSLIIVTGAIVWTANRPNDSSTPNPSSDSSGVKALVSYSVPTGWTEANCEDGNLIQIVNTEDSRQTCIAEGSPNSLVSIGVKDQITDCKQLQSASDVKKHICSTVFIDGRKTVKSTTEYLASSSQVARTVSNYYIDTGTSVVRAQYIYAADNLYQQQFDSLVNGVKIKT